MKTASRSGLLFLSAAALICAGCDTLNYASLPTERYRYFAPPDVPTATLEVRTLHADWVNQAVYQLQGEPLGHICSNRLYRVMGLLNGGTPYAELKRSSEQKNRPASVPVRIPDWRSQAMENEFGKESNPSFSLPIPATGESFRFMTFEHFGYTDSAAMKSHRSMCQPNVRFVPQAGVRYRATLGPNMCEIQLERIEEGGKAVMADSTRLAPCALQDKRDTGYYDDLIRKYTVLGKTPPALLHLWKTDSTFNNNMSELGPVEGSHWY